MTKKHPTDEAKIPKSRASRFAKMGSLASRIAGNMISEGVSELAKGNRPKVKDLLLTPKNMKRVADQLAQMRGAAMKVGQLVSMDAGDVLPKELTDLLARLRSDAKSMPQVELITVLQSHWGSSWQEKFIQFQIKPIASASIGQVHKAIDNDLRRLAIKVQYPGIKESIDSDVDNVASLIKLSGLLPKGMDIAPLLSEAKAQLHEEANYILEGQRLQRYAKLIEGDTRFLIPNWIPELSSHSVLAMTFLDGEPIEALCDANQSLRNSIASALFSLFFKELFEFQLVQTDPNFANFLYDSHEEKVVLLDFGATREYNKSMARNYLKLMQAGYHNDKKGIESQALELGLMTTSLSDKTRGDITEMCYLSCEPLYLTGTYDFAKSDLLERLRAIGTQMSLDKSYVHTPPVDTIFLHRKLGGLFLLAMKLKAKVDLRSMFEPYLGFRI
ncbi:AarF/ABC1/UbiB kinase family protein [Aliiglaciecola sp. 3_MG-2023]|uniref:ABC1 kinase family protein n=1 Tax=Aliiglaciecola sp. 3_MG-2023 TaxID=3062644 RepID=UPI0026E318E1|nr:AarF/ABC1/UbiB kinase family protein [Aliiglaciecola sp. 3_MG-2023]MDO6695477.1 AarF/ABC1/UbiB kinase family protein [Aliiglaciecola sp. 3_MG-2023]